MQKFAVPLERDPSQNSKEQSLRYTWKRDREREKQKLCEVRWSSFPYNTHGSLRYLGTFLIFIFTLTKASKDLNFHPKWKWNLTKFQYSFTTENNYGNLLPLRLIEVLEVATNISEWKEIVMNKKKKGTRGNVCIYSSVALLKQYSVFLVQVGQRAGDKARSTLVMEDGQKASK